MALGQGPGLYREGKETRRSPAKTTARERKGPKQSTKKHWETIYRNTTLARPTLKRRMGVEGAEANAGKRNLSYSIVNAIGGNNLRALKKPNKSREYNSNTLKNRNNRTKKLALLGKYFSRQPKV